MRRGFTISEMLAVVAVVGIVLAIALPAMRHARDSARNASCLANIRTIGQLATIYHDANRYRWPRQIAQLELGDRRPPLTCPRDRTPDALRSHGLWDPAFGMAAGVTETPTLEERVQQASPPGLLMVQDIRMWCDRQKTHRNGLYAADNAARRIK